MRDSRRPQGAYSLKDGCGEGSRSREVLWLAVLCLSAALLMLSACGRQTGTGKQSGAGEEHPNLIDDGDSVAITFPERMFSGIELSKDFIELNRYIDAYANEDGSVTVEMSKDRQQEFLSAFQEDVAYNIAAFTKELGYVKEITCAEDFRSMAFFVDGSTEKETLYELPYFFWLPLENYQLMLGQEVWMTMTVYDAKSRKVLLELRFPEDGS